MKLRTMLTAVGATALASMLLTACAQGTENPSSLGSSQELSVVVGLYPYAWLTEQIGGELVTVTNLTPPGAEPHDLELTTDQVARIAESDLTIFERSLQPAVDQAVAQAQPAHSFDITSVTPLEEHAIDADGTLEVDPHVWLDPVRMQTIAAAISSQLALVSPAHQSTFAANQAKLSTELANMDEAYRTGLSNCQRSTFITTHAAFGYMADRYHLTQVPIAGVEPDTDPSPTRIAEIQSLAIKDGITTIFFETLVSPVLAQSIADDLGLKTDILDPIEGITKESRGDDYPTIMQANLTALEQANGCAA
ncbi:MAG: metal ABC transporter substrate-binding protein [Propionibacteriaceae bacterium]|nr:metal ABC transporter substrate-binding protein [Propionibacteriaceae bacterium]